MQAQPIRVHGVCFFGRHGEFLEEIWSRLIRSKSEDVQTQGRKDIMTKASEDLILDENTVSRDGRRRGQQASSCRTIIVIIE
jgi:hypothetical protein